MTETKDVSLHALALGGDAVGRVEGQVVFVPYGAPGDKIAAGRWEAKPRFARAWIESVQTPAPDRVEAPCPYFFKPGAAPDAVCGGCHWQHMAYGAQAAAKKQLLIETFQRIGRVAHPPVEDTVTPADPWRYRNKVQIPFAPSDAPPGFTAGFYAPGTHRIVPFDDCLVQPDVSVLVFKAVKDWFTQHPVPVYNADTQEGWLRHLLIRTNAKGDALVAVVSRGENFPAAVEFAQFLTAQCPAVKSVFHNVNNQPGNVVLGPEWRHLHGKSYLEESVLGLRFRLSPGAFFQVHHAMAEKLYALVEKFVAPAPDRTVLELYAGVGAIGQILAKKSRRVWAVEENPQAVDDGVASAGWNKIDNIKYTLGRCETALARGRFLQGANDTLGAVVLDPPRAGCDQLVLRGVMRMKPRKIVYVSCDPGTLARDARYLSTGGYHLKRVVPVDLFPQTSHIESVSLFEPAAATGPSLDAPASASVRATETRPTAPPHFPRRDRGRGPRPGKPGRSPRRDGR